MSDVLDGGLSSVRRVAAPLREQVTDLLREAIADRRLAPGARLVERELVESLGVSRATVREALCQLTAEGLVTAVPQRGAVVAAPTSEEVAELHEVRAALEGLAARRFVERASASQLEALLRAFVEVTDVALAGDDADIGTLLAAKDRFYDVLLNGSGSSAVHVILARSKARIGALRAVSVRRPGRVAESLAELAALAQAIERGDARAAEEAAAHHVEMAARALAQPLPSATPRRSA